jgi:hypothetical protein
MLVDWWIFRTNTDILQHVINYIKLTKIKSIIKQLLLCWNAAIHKLTDVNELDTV